MYAAPAYYTEAPHYYNTEALKYNTTSYAAPSHYTDALKYYSAPSYYTTKATEQDYACCPILLHRGSKVLLCSQLFIAQLFLNTTLFPVATRRLPLITPPKSRNYTEAAKYFYPPIYITTTEEAKDYEVLTCYTKAALSYYVEQRYYTDAPVYFTTTHATLSYNTEAPKYYTEDAAYYTTTYAA
jgi:hypothetical protein